MSEIARSAAGSVFSRWWWVGLLSAIGFAVLGVFAGLVTAYLVPKKFESVTVIQVQGSPGASAPEGTGVDAALPVIGSKESRDKVAANLRLGTRWATSDEEASKALDGSIRANVIRGTDLIEIKVKHTNPQDARDIAVEVVTVLQQLRHGNGERFIVHESPKISSLPVSPNVPLLLILGAGGGFLFGLVAAYPIMRIADKRVDRNSDRGGGFHPPSL